MTLETIYYIGQTGAVVAIVASLVAIYWQQREANKMARVENAAGLSSNYAESLKDVMNNAELAEIFRKVMFQDEVLNTIEATQILLYFNIMVANHRNVWLAHANGLYDDDIFNMNVANTAWYLSKPIFVNEWKRCREVGFYSGAFAEHIDSLIKPIAKITPQPDEEQADGGPNA